MHVACSVIDCNNTAIRGLGGLAASFEEVAYVSTKVLQLGQPSRDGNTCEIYPYHNRRVGIASRDSYWLKFAAGARQYFLAPAVLRAVWGPGGAAWSKKTNAQAAGRSGGL